jgi:hypothetical protein
MKSKKVLGLDEANSLGRLATVYAKESCHS